MSHTAYQKNILGLSNTQQAIIQDQWSHLELMEPHCQCPLSEQCRLINVRPVTLRIEPGASQLRSSNSTSVLCLPPFACLMIYCLGHKKSFFVVQAQDFAFNFICRAHCFVTVGSIDRTCPLSKLEQCKEVNTKNRTWGSWLRSSRTLPPCYAVPPPIYETRRVGKFVSRPESYVPSCVCVFLHTTITPTTTTTTELIPSELKEKVSGRWLG